MEIPPPPPLPPLFPPPYLPSPPLPPPSPFFPFPPPPRAADQITVIHALPPPPPQPLFPTDSSSVDLSPLEFLLALIAVVTIPALIYTFLFSLKCPNLHRSSSSSVPPSINGSDPPPPLPPPPPPPPPVVVSDVKYQKDAHVKEIGTECPVCLSVFGDGDDVRILTACKHSFHSSCIDMWLSNHENCPICRAHVAAVKRLNPTAAPVRNFSDLQQGLPDASSLV